jgi:hypothetical protein
MDRTDFADILRRLEEVEGRVFAIEARLDEERPSWWQRCPGCDSLDTCRPDGGRERRCNACGTRYVPGNRE